VAACSATRCSRGGAGQRHGFEDLVPAETVAQLKGRDMMVDRFAELLGVTTTS
jgi:hypothetical protein